MHSPKIKLQLKVPLVARRARSQPVRLELLHSQSAKRPAGRALRIYWLRIVRQQSERARRKDCGTIHLLGDEIELPKEYINQFTLTRLDITREQLSVMVEVEGKRVEVIKENKMLLNNANFTD